MWLTTAALPVRRRCVRLVEASDSRRRAIQPPTFPDSYVAALKSVRGEIVAGGSPGVRGALGALDHASGLDT
jgi:hypothetical protein